MLPYLKNIKMTFENLDGGWLDFSMNTDEKSYLFGLSYLGQGMAEIISATLVLFSEKRDQAIFFDLESGGNSTLRLLWNGDLLRIRVDQINLTDRKHWKSAEPVFDFTCQPALFVAALNKAVSDVIGKYGYKGFNKGWQAPWAPESKITTGLLRRLDELAQSLPPIASAT